MQGTYERGYRKLCLVCNNAAEGSLRFARSVKINAILMTFIHSAL
jgi:hypothetical protein